MRGILMILIWVAFLVLLPRQARAQTEGEAALLVDAAAGPIVLGLGPCGQESAPGLSAGVEVRNRGPWTAAAGADLLLPGVIRSLLDNVGCTGPLTVLRHGGEQAYVAGYGATHPPVRLSVGFGRAFPALPLTPVLRAAAGFIPMNTAFGTTMNEPRIERTDFDLEPWFGGRLSIGGASHPVGLRLEMGTHRLRRRIYAEEDDRLLGEIHHWSWIVGSAVTFALRR